LNNISKAGRIFHKSREEKTVRIVFCRGMIAEKITSSSTNTRGRKGQGGKVRMRPVAAENVTTRHSKKDS